MLPTSDNTVMTDLENDGVLNDTWSLYFHDPFNEDWTYASYHKICDITSAVEYWEVFDTLRDYFSRGMFFIFREHVFPCWDDESNINGGCISIKVLKKDLTPLWEDITMRMLGESFLKKEKMIFWNNVNGMSISPKKAFSIIKIWLKSQDVIDPYMFEFPASYTGGFVYRSNQQNIDENHQKMSITKKRCDSTYSHTSEQSQAL